MLSPRGFRGASWCFALVLLAVLCASLLVCSVAVEACGLAPEQGYRLVLRLACFLSLPRDRARKFRNQARETHETLQLQTPGQRAQHVFAAFPGIEPESSEPKRSRNSRNAPAPNARRARAAREQGLHATHHTRNPDARDALATLASWCLLVLCSGSSRRSLCGASKGCTRPTTLAILMLAMLSPRLRAQEVPRRTQEAPGAPQEPPKRPNKSAVEGSFFRFSLGGPPGSHF